MNHRMNAVQIIGRGTSHFTRVATIFAHELAVPFELVTVYDLMSLDVATYGGNPALKIPTIIVAGSSVFGAENCCRKLAELAGRADDPRIVFPERATSDVVRSAQELTWHAISAQVQLILGTMLGKLPHDHPFFEKSRRGLRGALAWLDENLARALDTLPKERDLSMFEVTLFCLVEHLAFRRTLDEEAPASLRRFAAEFGARASAQQTPYVLAPRPT